MIEEILLMTKSKMFNGYCVTGINKRNGEWVRLCLKDEESFPIYKFKFPGNNVPELLDTIVVDLKEKCGDEVHPEDYLINGAIIAKGNASRNVFEERLEKDYEKEYIYYDDQHRISNDELGTLLELEDGYSLLVVRVDDLEIIRNIYGKLVANFTYKGIKYEQLRITDPDLEDEMINNIGLEAGYKVDALGTRYLVISLGKAFLNQTTYDIEHYKLVAAVIDEKMLDEKLGKQ